MATKDTIRRDNQTRQTKMTKNSQVVKNKIQKRRSLLSFRNGVRAPVKKSAFSGLANVKPEILNRKHVQENKDYCDELELAYSAKDRAAMLVRFDTRKLLRVVETVHARMLLSLVHERAQLFPTHSEAHGHHTHLLKLATRVRAWVLENADVDRARAHPQHAKALVEATKLTQAAFMRSEQHPWVECTGACGWFRPSVWHVECKPLPTWQLLPQQRRVDKWNFFAKPPPPSSELLGLPRLRLPDYDPQL